jgi:hypothetical protein
MASFAVEPDVTLITATVFRSVYPKGDQQKPKYRNITMEHLNMTSSNTHELTAEELDAAAAGVKIGPISVEWSKGCGCVDVSLAGVGGFFVGLGGAGAYSGDRFIRLY